MITTQSLSVSVLVQSLLNASGSTLLLCVDVGSVSYPLKHVSGFTFRISSSTAAASVDKAPNFPFAKYVIYRVRVSVCRRDLNLRMTDSHRAPPLFLLRPFLSSVVVSIFKTNA